MFHVWLWSSIQKSNVSKRSMTLKINTIRRKNKLPSSSQTPGCKWRQLDWFSIFVSLCESSWLSTGTLYPHVGRFGTFAVSKSFALAPARLLFELSNIPNRVRALYKKLKTFFVESYLYSFISELIFITFRTNPWWWNSSYEHVTFWHSRHTYFPTYLRSSMHDHKTPLSLYVQVSNMSSLEIPSTLTFESLSACKFLNVARIV